ncbi:hypothetical protein N0V94_008285 [Neodidymelliopsis sp. IMI 364377]|nr:hypothetical protein N0V94_008285 [Neodidymelliopsis sp. IMI 364377]
MDWDEFQRRTRAIVLPKSLQPGRCLIAVLYHENDSRQQLKNADFLWMRGHANTPVRKIYQEYEKHRNCKDFHLVSLDRLIEPRNKLKDITDGDPELVVFKAVHASKWCGSSELPSSVARPQTPLEVYPKQSAPTEKCPTPCNEEEFKAGVALTEPHVPSTSTTPCTPLATHSQEESVKPSQCDTPQNLPHADAPDTEPLTQEVQARQASFDLSTGQLRSANPTSTERFGPDQQQETPAFPNGHKIVTLPTFQKQPVNLSITSQQTENRSIQPSSTDPQAQSESVSHGLTDSQIRLTAEKSPPRPSAAVLSPDSPPFASSGAVTAVQSAGSESQAHVPPTSHNQAEDAPSRPFDPGHFFDREETPIQDVGKETKPAYNFVKAIMEQENPVLLEAGVQQSLVLLDKFKQSFSEYAASDADAQAWIESIDKLIPQAKRKRTVIGVIGNTGAGKSSVINALLDEERLLPTNCMRACTAVVTEISWNDSTEPFSKYRAEIEFLSREEWGKEVALLMKEFLNENGKLQPDASNQDTDAGIAWAKFHAVYPKVTKDELGNCTVSGLMADKDLLVLGTTKKIGTSFPENFYQELQRFVDSKEKVTKKSKKDNGDGAPTGMECWPLIKVVRIYTKAPALSTGAVVVDLPGVHDSNAARAAVAQRYMKQCTGLWIVAPITRAVDDKAAKTLLGNSFKLQLKYDGVLSTVTFICSKTDDISITEAIDTLGLADEVETLYEQQHRLEDKIKDTRNKITHLEELKKVYGLVEREASDGIETWENLKESLDDGSQVFAPRPKSTKRKKSETARKSRKKLHTGRKHSHADFFVDENPGTEESDDEVRAPQEPLTEGDIKTKLKTLRETRKNARSEGAEIKPKIDELRPQIHEAQAEIKALKAEVSRICISGRNEYSKEAIQMDFAAGIKELDQENAAEEDEETFNPDEEQRDYEQVARNLPVFCVSSRAYQKMCKRLQKDDPVPGFNAPEETEMPQLQTHCRKLTELGRGQSSRNFLLGVCQLLSTFTLWASNDGTGLNITDEDMSKQIKSVKRRLSELEDGLDACIKACIDAIEQELEYQIYDKFSDLVQNAINAAPNTVAAWGATKDRGGLPWSSYKATVRRNGIFRSTTVGKCDFNSDLVDPIVKKLATGWERAFLNRLPKAFSNFIGDSGKLLHKFHEAVEMHVHHNGVSLASLSTLKTQIHNYEMLFGKLNPHLIQLMTKLQREANRDFAPTIENFMSTVHEVCAEESGKGSFVRMKAAMSEYVERNRHTMFNQATLTVKRHLEAMCRSLRQLIEEQVDEIFLKIQADYMRVLGGVKLIEAASTSKEKAMRNEVMDILRGVDAQFKPIANGEFSPQHLAGGDVESADLMDDEGSVPSESDHESTDEDAMTGEDEDSDTEDIVTGVVEETAENFATYDSDTDAMEH